MFGIFSEGYGLGMTMFKMRSVKMWIVWSSMSSNERKMDMFSDFSRLRLLSMHACNRLYCLLQCELHVSYLVFYDSSLKWMGFVCLARVFYCFSWCRLVLLFWEVHFLLLIISFLFFLSCVYPFFFFFCNCWKFGIYISFFHGIFCSYFVDHLV